ncbi:mannitol dehydrogenase family protein [Oceanibium sediminis]|uniref:mannitol dehydrogenase family protein n=1 Tax=Oceanibium sediminis TaxID=2026339 RepID=UPI0018E4E4A4|nr:mannitol dehydrogenase family protein [Oceanibium sediminis]
MRILHFGIGNFHRAHQAWYTQDANRRTGSVWRITSVSLRHPDLRDRLRGVGFRYTLRILGPDGVRDTAMAVHDDILFAPEDPQAVIACLAEGDTRIVTVTVTEKGYCLTGAGLDLDHPDISADLRSGAPRSLVGLLAAGLRARAATGQPLTVISCDNLPDNSATLKAAIEAFLAAQGHDILAYLDKSVRFANTMVDRITPATTEALRTTLAEPEPVATEAFSDWVIEDNFATPIPDWAGSGATITADVAPYELRKLWLLNGAHSFLAYAGLNAGHALVSDAVGDPALASAMGDLMRAAAAVLPAGLRQDAEDYIAALLARFANPNIEHRLAQIAQDGSLKLPVRILAPRRARAAAGLDTAAHDRAITEWVRFLRAAHVAQAPLNDPRGAALGVAAAQGGAQGALSDLALGLALLGETGGAGPKAAR